jgi:hypothetical protein
MAVQGMIRRACWNLALVVLTGTVVVWARWQRQPVPILRSDAGLVGGIVLNERNFDLTGPAPVSP